MSEITQKVAVIDYGMGNLRSVLNALHHVGAEGVLVTDPAALAGFERIILPGVGAFGEAIANLERLGMAEALTVIKDKGVPILGICLGMQLMCRNSEEDGMHQGLGWFDAIVRRFPDDAVLKVPHIGWNNLHFNRTHFLSEGLPDNPDVYFVHSYHVNCADSADVLATCNYGKDFTAIFAKQNVAGMQFHPEKSQAVGLRLLKNFVDSATC